MVVPPAPVRVPSQRPLAPSVASVKSVANDKDDNEIIPGAVHRAPDIYFTAEENLISTSYKTYVSSSDTNMCYVCVLSYSLF